MRWRKVKRKAVVGKVGIDQLGLVECWLAAPLWEQIAPLISSSFWTNVRSCFHIWIRYAVLMWRLISWKIGVVSSEGALCRFTDGDLISRRQILIVIFVIAYTGLSRRWVSYGRRRRCLVWPETEMSCMAGDGDASYGRRWLLTDMGWWHSAVLALSYILALWPS